MRPAYRKDSLMGQELQGRGDQRSAAWTVQQVFPHVAFRREVTVGQSSNLRRAALLHYASCVAVFPIPQDGPVCLDSGHAGQSRDRRDVLTADSCTAASAFFNSVRHQIGTI
jgi:hypothetical protein